MTTESRKDNKPYQHMTDKNQFNAKVLFGSHHHERLKNLDAERSQQKEQAKAVEGEYVYKSEYRKKIDIEFFDMQNLTKSELARIGKMIIGKTPNEIMDLVLDGEACALHVMMASVITRIIRTGDINAFNQLMDRLIGKIDASTSGKDDDQTIDVGNAPLQVVIDNSRKIRLPANGRESSVG